MSKYTVTIEGPLGWGTFHVRGANADEAKEAGVRAALAGYGAGAKVTLTALSARKGWR